MVIDVLVNRQSLIITMCLKKKKSWILPAEMKRTVIIMFDIICIGMWLNVLPDFNTFHIQKVVP